jgi:ADP-glucose pyrophosphorylase
MSNCFNSGINKIFVMTQFNSASLNRHIHRTYLGGGINFTDGSVQVIYLILLICVSGNNFDRGNNEEMARFYCRSMVQNIDYFMTDCQLFMS